MIFHAWTLSKSTTIFLKQGSDDWDLLTWFSLVLPVVVHCGFHSECHETMRKQQLANDAVWLDSAPGNLFQVSVLTVWSFEFCQTHAFPSVARNVLGLAQTFGLAGVAHSGPRSFHVLILVSLLMVLLLVLLQVLGLPRGTHRKQRLTNCVCSVHSCSGLSKSETCLDFLQSQ